MSNFNIQKVIDELIDCVSSNADPGKYTVDRGSPTGRPEIDIVEFQPTVQDASYIRLIAIEGTSELDIELEGDARWEWLARRGQSEHEFANEIAPLLQAVIRNGFTQRVWVHGNEIVRSKTVVQPVVGKAYRCSGARLRQPSLRMPKRVDRNYAGWN